VSILFGRYELFEPLGSGGTATVYRARDQKEGRDVALKIVPPGPDVHAMRQRFASEARTLARLRSRRICGLLDHGVDETGGMYLSLELVADPLSLEPKSFGRPLLPHEVLRVARALFEGIADAHDAGILHLDIKPRNVLVSGASAYGIESPKIVDFGIAVKFSNNGLPHDIAGAGELTWGTPDYMPPEALARGAVSAQNDIYAGGLILFELLGVGLLHSGSTREERLRARLAKDPVLSGRVPEPLSVALGRMLARDVKERFQTARDAYEYIADLDTAPVNSRGPMSEPPRKTMPPPPASLAASLSPATLSSEEMPPASVRPGAWGGTVSSPPSFSSPASVRPSVIPPTGDAARNQDDVPSVPAPAPLPAIAAPPPRLYSVSDTPERALSDVVGALDMAMLDAISRRERSSAFGRILRALALTLRLDLDAAALLLEPVAAQHPAGAMIGVTMLAPRARRVTRARVDSARSDEWASRVEPELAARAAAFAVAIGGREDAERSVERLERIGARVSVEARPHAWAQNVLIAKAVAALTLGQKDATSALEEADDAMSDVAVRDSAFDECVRSLLVALAAQRVDPDRAVRELRRSLAGAMRVSCTLLEVRVLASLGAALLESEGHADEGQRFLSRASVLLAHGDAPSLLHAVEQSRGGSLVHRGAYKEAADRFKIARAAARAEVALDLEATSATNEIVARMGAGQRAEAKELAQELTDAKLSMMLPRTQAFALTARALTLLSAFEFDGAGREAARAKERVQAARIETSDVAFARAAIEALAMTAKGSAFDEASALKELEALSVARGFAVLYWVDILEAAVKGAPEKSAGKLHAFTQKMRDRLVPNRERQTSPPV
jgi:serine/threonine protein kinase